LRKSFRKSDIIARIGGDEFVILCMETSETSIERLLLRLYQNIYNFNSVEERPFKISISTGFSIFDPKSSLSLEELLDIADKRMYEDKNKKKVKPPG
ncbi:MAG: GGDEF domain-containing protein, partial [Dictyoglomaceae bacterium]|nr:GGDEF domain-containing protein [Dictyoglomaceae bacterium]